MGGEIEERTERAARERKEMYREEGVMKRELPTNQLQASNAAVHYLTHTLRVESPLCSHNLRHFKE